MGKANKTQCRKLTFLFHKRLHVKQLGEADVGVELFLMARLSVRRQSFGSGDSSNSSHLKITVLETHRASPEKLTHALNLSNQCRKGRADDFPKSFHATQGAPAFTACSPARGLPVKHETHQLQVERAGKTEQPDLPRGVLLALTSFAKITIVPFQFFFLSGEGRQKERS